MHNLFIQILNKFYSKNKFKFYFLILLSLIAGLFEYLGLILIFQFILFLNNPTSSYCKKIIYFFNNYFNITEFSKIGLILGCFIAFIYVFKNIYMLFFTRFNNKILEDLSVQITLKTFKNLLFSPYILTKNLSVTDKVNILSKITLVVWQYCYKFINFVINVIIAAILLFYLFYKFTKVALVAFLFLAVLSVIEYFYLKNRSNVQNKTYTKILENVNKILLTILNSIKEIKINNQEEFFLSKSEIEYKKLASLNKDRNFNDVIHIYITEIFVMLGFVLILSVLFYTTKFNNQILISSLCTICVLILRIAPSINRAQSSIYAINSNKQAVVDLIDFDNKFCDFVDCSITKEKLPFNNSIKLNNISFGYDEKKVLNNINLEIHKNDFVRIIGKSASGKTTLALIISGLIQAQSGEILIDDKKLIDYKKWLNNVAFLSQDFTFLSDKVNEILDFNDKKTNQLIEDMNLSNIQNKKIQELSSGEKQRIALVDILLKDKNVIIFDEATANIDVVSVNLITKILEDYKKQKTIISITHNLNNIKDEDKVILIENSSLFFDEYAKLKSRMEF